MAAALHDHCVASFPWVNNHKQRGGGGRLRWARQVIKRAIGIVLSVDSAVGTRRQQWLTTANRRNLPRRTDSACLVPQAGHALAVSLDLRNRIVKESGHWRQRVSWTYQSLKAVAIQWQDRSNIHQTTSQQSRLVTRCSWPYNFYRCWWFNVTYFGLYSHHNALSLSVV